MSSELIILIAEATVIGTAGFFAGKIIYGIILAIFRRIVKKTETLIDDYVIEAIEKPLELTTIVFCFFFISEFFGNLGAINALISKYLFSIVIILGSYLASEIIGGILKGYAAESERKNSNMDLSLLPFLRQVSRIFIPLIGFSVGLSVIGVDLTGIFTLTSVIALILGLASQETLANLFAGLALQIDRQFYYGDYIRFVNGDIARLRKIGVRTSRLEDLNGNRVTLSNSEFAKLKVTNLSRAYNKANISMPAEIPIGTDTKKLEADLRKKLANQKILASKSISVSMDQIAKDCIRISASFSLERIENINAAKDAINREILEFAHKGKK